MRTRTQNATKALLRGSVALLLAFTVPLLQGCDSASGGGTQTNGGTAAAAGVTGAAGQANGGIPQAAGTTTIPGSTGGTPQVGGTTVATTPSDSGGSTTVTGGDTGGTTTVAGGRPSTGGRTTPTGGRTGGGGSTVLGGAPGSGGATTPTGGTPAPTGGNTTVAPPTTGHYQMENLDRGVVAVKVTGGVYVGWRMMGYEYTGTDSDTSYNLYKDGTLLKNVTDSTNYLDAAGTSTSKYTVSAVLKGKEGAQSAPVTVWANQYLSIPITAPPNGPLGGVYTANDASPCDLDGDGQMDIVLKWDPSNSQDSSFSNKSDDVYIDGLKLDGTRLWRIDIGVNIRAGAHDTQMSVYDFDGDGKCEVAFKTAPGTKDGKGNYLKKGPAAGVDNSQDLRGPRGMTLGGPEWLTVFSGADGSELDTIEYPVLYGSRNWGDSNGNRSQRFNGGFAFVKDVPAGGGAAVANGLPSIIQQRGYYTYLTVSALTFRNGALAKNWVYDSVTTIPNGGGDHSCMAADVDGDGAQEIIPGARTINSDGTFKCDSGMGHGDAMDIAPLIPGKPMVTFSIHESLGGSDAHDSATCTFYYKITNPGTDANRGRAEYVGAGDETSASCNGGGATGLCLTGTGSAPSAGSNFVIYWDDDEWRELENGTSITKASGTTLLNASGCASNNGTKSDPTLTADMLGDWREEVIYRESAGAALRMYTTTTVTKRRIYTLMHDPTYRAQVNFEQASYNQPPHPGFQISPNMPAPPVPDIFIAGSK
ncbi:MAG: rhamnogalacturonan lyase [Polyangia bacterium]